MQQVNIIHDSMLKELSGNTHTVYTGVTLLTKDKTKTFIAASDVKFATLYDEEIDYYVDTFSPMDKAGAYGIQGRASLFVKGITGDYFNVVGLPVARLNRELKG